jgi:hypothetical protein
LKRIVGFKTINERRKMNGTVDYNLGHREATGKKEKVTRYLKPGGERVI